MSEPTLERSRLLWRTRGQHWDYLFLLRPEQPVLPGWIQVFEQVFPDDRAPAEGVFYARGSLKVGSRSGRRYEFVAAALTDPERRDFADRRIQHFFIYLLKDDSDIERFTFGWAQRLLARLSRGLNAVFTEQRGDEDPLAFSGRLIRELGTQLTERIPIGTGYDPVDWQTVPEIIISDQKSEDEKKNPRARAYGGGSEDTVDSSPYRTGAPALSSRLYEEKSSEPRGRTERILGMIASWARWVPPDAMLKAMIEPLAKRLGPEEAIHLLERQIAILRSKGRGS